ncbi:hypothetical protein HJFPF1_07464 [Paramyrothecium foliicola]|nr:hypothetical protein HJFPF1_07464 [Paramyrothecium foliicola]
MRQHKQQSLDDKFQGIDRNQRRIPRLALESHEYAPSLLLDRSLQHDLTCISLTEVAPTKRERMSRYLAMLRPESNSAAMNTCTSCGKPGHSGTECWLQPPLKLTQISALQAEHEKLCKEAAVNLWDQTQGPMRGTQTWKDDYIMDNDKKGMPRMTVAPRRSKRLQQRAAKDAAAQTGSQDADNKSRDGPAGREVADKISPCKPSTTSCGRTAVTSKLSNG